jgi:hypothetical protein
MKHIFFIVALIVSLFTFSVVGFTADKESLGYVNSVVMVFHSTDGSVENYTDASHNALANYACEALSEYRLTVLPVEKVWDTFIINYKKNHSLLSLGETEWEDFLSNNFMFRVNLYVDRCMLNADGTYDAGVRVTVVPMETSTSILAKGSSDLVHSKEKSHQDALLHAVALAVNECGNHFVDKSVLKF